MKKVKLFFLPLLVCFIAIFSCNKEEPFIAPIPDVIITGNSEFEIYDTTFVLNATELTEGLTGFWEVIENNDSYSLSDSLNPNCQFIGEFTGQYKLRWTVSNGEEEKYEDVSLRMLKTIPDKLLNGESEYELYIDSIFLNGISLTEGLTGYWEVIENTDFYSLSDSLNPNCQFIGALLGQYKLRWTVTNEKDVAYEDILISIVGFTDSRDSIKYKVVQIGNQIWMAENLKATKYNNNNPITLVEDNMIWINATAGAYCWYGNNEAANRETYGALYNWFAVESGNLCPDGWHVPTDTEWSNMILHIDPHAIVGITEESAIAGNILKSTSGWNNNGNGIDEYGFNALPSGYRARIDGQFIGVGDRGHWWTIEESTSTEAWNRNIYNSHDYIWRGSYHKAGGISIRCIKN